MISAAGLRKMYPGGASEVLALDGVDLEIARGESVAVTGPSGCGKSTLLHCLGGLDEPDSGRLEVGGRSLAGLGDTELARFRRGQVGFVFQFFNLLPTLTVRENVLLPSWLAGSAGERRADMLLERTGLTGRGGHRPYQLSGGEMQRTAIARALINHPALLLADEPTGNLDSTTSRRVLELLGELARDEGITLVLVTHDDEVADAMGRRIRMRDGRIVNAR